MELRGGGCDRVQPGPGAQGGALVASQRAAKATTEHYGRGVSVQPEDDCRLGVKFDAHGREFGHGFGFGFREDELRSVGGFGDVHLGVFCNAVASCQASQASCVR